MNKHPHCLGSTGYHHKVVQWNRIIEEAIANSTLDPILKDIDERAIRWILGRAGLSEDGKLLQDRKSTRLNSSHITRSRMPSSA